MRSPRTSALLASLVAAFGGGMRKLETAVNAEQQGGR
jgi:hypothetical protein